MSDAEFVAVWRELTGEPPSVLIDRDEMIGLLRATLDGTTWLDRTT